jgi:pyruvate formate lyase activating enzyme
MARADGAVASPGAELSRPGRAPADARAATGRVHSVETGGTVDGPGVRFVLFTAGCPLSCLYCHNPDCRAASSGRLTTAGAMVDEIGRYAEFLRRAKGGVTVSGGEPLSQPRFVQAVLEGCKALGLHTALDTSGFLGARATPALLEATDLVLLDIKSWEPRTYRRVTGVGIEPTIDFARRLARLGKPTWVRFVVVPGLTDAPGNVAGLAAFVATLSNVERVELLPFHKLGEYKWRALGLPYTLGATQPPTPEQLARVGDAFRAHGVKVA